MKSNSGEEMNQSNTTTVGSTSVTNSTDKKKECQENDCECYLRRGQMFLPPNLLLTTDGDDKR